MDTSNLFYATIMGNFIKQILFLDSIAYIREVTTMTVRELKERLERFPESCVVLINADIETRREHDGFPYTEATCVVQGFNELDGCVIIDDYAEEEDYDQNVL
jgi:hypothetical protein